MTQKRFVRHLAALDNLEPGATPTEQTYYQSLREKYENAPPRLQNSGPSEETLESRARNIDEGHKGLFYYRYELSKPDLDPIWKGWLEDKHSERQKILDEMIVELQRDGHDYHPPTFDLEQQRRKTESERIQLRITGLENLIYLKQVWAERNNKKDILDKIIQPYTQEIEDLKSQLEQLQ